ncbi:MAG: aldehyde dehydrogenase [Myxococcota bacterium]|nr:aldehyde dehydrogenase [Myxococcota bacterium]MDW8362405.1 aldehyde dehydrogenase [Myxococcales bacterium]
MTSSGRPGGLDEASVEALVEAIVGRVRARLGVNRTEVPRVEPVPASPAAPVAATHPAAPFVAPKPAPAPPAAPAVIAREPEPGIHDDLEQAVAAAREAFERMRRTPLAVRHEIVAAMRRVALEHLDEMAERAVAETGLGRVADKRIKNHVAITKTPGPEFLEPIARSGDDGLVLVERAPYGVICSVTPCTNPTETIINNAIGMVSGGNSVLFNVHPLARRTSAWYIALLNRAIASAGGPPALLHTLREPSIETAQAAMRHPGVRLVVVTGGGAVVQEAMRSGKRAICAGPGNPPCVVDETAHVEVAARGIVAGVSFDNNVICTDEKAVVVVEDVADRLLRELERHGARRLTAHEVRRAERTFLDAQGHINREFVGKDARVLLAALGTHTSDDIRMLFAELPEEHPIVQVEMLMPIVGVVRKPDVGEAIEAACRIEHGYGHTAVMYSTNIEALSHMARRIDTSIFVKNAPSFAGIGAGGEGYTSWTIASPTGEGLTTCRTFTRERRCTLKDHFRIV